MAGTTTSVLKDLLTELRMWRSSPGRRERINMRSPLREIPDKTPVEVPVGYKSPPTLAELVQTYVRQEVSQAASAQGLGTFEEEDDYEIEDPDDLPFSQYEVTEYQMAEEIEVIDASPPDGEPSSPVPEGDAEPPETEPQTVQKSEQ